MELCVCVCVGGWGWGWWWGGGSLNPFSPPACPHPVFSRAACESSHRAEGPSCLPLPPPSSSAFPSLNPPLPMSRPSSKPGAAIGSLAFLSPFPWPHTRFQAESCAPNRVQPTIFCLRGDSNLNREREMNCTSCPYLRSTQLSPLLLRLY